MIRSNPLLPWLLAGCMTLAGCGGGGGGGGDDEPPPPAQGWAVSGAVTLPDTAAVDSDTNDVNQSARAANGSLAAAQPLTVPALVVGTVNQPGQGPAGPNRAAGDVDDLYRVTLVAGQTVELEFASDTAGNDIDLYVLDATSGTERGLSVGINQFECVRIDHGGEYALSVHAHRGASIYNLRVTAPGEGSPCDNATTPAGSPVVPDQLIAKPRTQAVARERAMQAARQAGLSLAQGDAAGHRPVLLQLPAVAAPSVREQRLALASALPPEARRVRETVRQMKQLRATGDYEYVELNLRVQLTALVGSFPPNDRAYPLQRWHYEMVSLPAAMQRLVSLSPQPAQRPVVAVIDSGIVTDHPDLAEQIVDGYSFVAGSGGTNTADPDDVGTRDTATFHGSHVAGTIAAVTFNGTGVASVAPMAQLMPLRVFRDDGNASLYDVLQALSYAARLPNDAARLPARRADVVNLSLRATGACTAAFADVVAQARAQGVMVVAAAGNDARNDEGRAVAVGMPANCPGVIAVGALDASKRQAFYSNSGPQLRLAAPGGDMRRATTGTGEPDGVYSTVATFTAGGSRVPSYGQMMGTSMAAPHVAGTLALMRYVHPAITPAQVDALIDAGRLSDDLGPAGRDDATGYGVVHAGKAVDAALELRDGTPPPPPEGEVRASPSSLHFGGTRGAMELTLALSAADDETVQSVTSNLAAVSVTPIAVATETGLGSYRVAVDRTALPDGTSYAMLTVQTSERSFTVPVSVVKSAAGTGGNFGRLYVLVLDAATGDAIAQSEVDAAGGRYEWRVAGVTAGAVQVVAGTDLDNDGIICQRGEVCGAYPVLAQRLEEIALDGDRSGLDFAVAPFGSVSGQSVGTSRGGWRRMR